MTTEKNVKPGQMDFRDSKINVSKKLIALEGGRPIKKFKKDPDRFKKQYTPYNVAILAPPGNCGQDCNYCSAEFMRLEYSKIVESLGHKMNTDISPNFVMEVISQLPDCGTKALTFTGGGDWSIYEWLPEIFEHAKSIGLEVGLISHFAGRKFSDNDLGRIIDNSDWLRGSLDGYDLESYNHIRHPKNSSDFYTMQHNLRRISEIMESKGRSKKLFGVQMVVCRENYDWVPEVVMCAEGLGVGYIQVRPVELRGSFVSVDGSTTDSGQQRYVDKYDGFWQLDEARKLCEMSSSSIDVVFRSDKVDVIYRDGNFTELPKQAFKNCVGSHFSGNIIITDPVVLTHCFWRYDHAMIVDEGGLKDAFFSDERAGFYEKTDSNRQVCSNLCKYAIFNPEWETNFALLSYDDFEVIVDQFRGVRIDNPYFL